MGVAIVLGDTLLDLGRVLVASALGEFHHARRPEGSPGEIVRGFTFTEDNIDQFDF